MMRFVPPAGTPLKMADVLGALWTSVSSNGRVEEALSSFAAYLRIRHVLGVSSGRTALWLILKSLYRLRPDRCVVALPAYNCFSVPAAVVRAGLKLYPVDVDPETLDFDFSRLEEVPQGKLLCILTSNLFGLVNDLDRIRKIATDKGAFLVDDAAQSLGASRSGHFSGTGGDVGFYSLGRGKAMAAGEGGLIVTDSEEFADAIRAEIENLHDISSGQSASLMLKVLAYSVFLHPRLYWFPNSIPFLKLGVTEFDPFFPTARMPRFTQALVSRLIDTLDEANRIRRRNAHRIAMILTGNPYFSMPKPCPGSQPTYVRFPLVAQDLATRNHSLNRLRKAGIGAASFYPSAICDIPGIGHYMYSSDFHRPRAEGLSTRLLTLPTHAFVGENEFRRMGEVLRNC